MQNNITLSIAELAELIRELAEMGVVNDKGNGNHGVELSIRMLKLKKIYSSIDE